MITIYGQDGTPKFRVEPGGSSQQDKSLGGDNVLSLSFTHWSCLLIDVNDYADFFGERYYAAERCHPKQKSSVEWEYNLKLYGTESLIKRFLVLQNSDGEQEAVFALTGNAREHLRLIVQSINAGFGTTDWKAGACVESDNLTLDYEGTYCDEALRQLAEAAGTEWWIEGQTVNLCRCERGEEVRLRYPDELTGLERDEADGVKFYTRLFPKGSSRNIDRATYGHSRLQLPGGAKYVDTDTARYGVIHHYEESAFSGIYPRRVGRVGRVRHEEVTGTDGEPFTIYYFDDPGIPGEFDPDGCLMEGLVAHVSFQSGELAGRDFEVNYDSESHEFEIITVWPYDDGMQLPGGMLVPKEDDEYILWNVKMPSKYYALAEQEFRSAVDAFNAEHWTDKSVYKAPVRHTWQERSGEPLYVGRRVRLESSEFFPETDGSRQSRITRVVRKASAPFQTDIEVSDAVGVGRMDQVTDSIHDVRMYAREALAGLPDLIRSNDGTLPTDNNIFSARRAVLEFLRKTGDDEMAGVLTALGFTGGTVKSPDWLPGARGFKMQSEEGVASLELDTLKVRKRLEADELEIRRVTYTGGRQVLSSAGSTITRVEPLYGTVAGVAAAASTGSSAQPVTTGGRRVVAIGAVGADVTVWRCYFKADDGDRHTRNWWRAGDLAQCKTLNLDQNRYYWRLVTGAGADYFDLSASVFDPSTPNDAPQAGDVVVQYGNTSEPARQNAIVLDTSVPMMMQLTGIRGFGVGETGEVVTYFSPEENILTGTLTVRSKFRNADGQVSSLAGGLVTEALRTGVIQAGLGIIDELHLTNAHVRGFINGDRYTVDVTNGGLSLDLTRTGRYVWLTGSADQYRTVWLPSLSTGDGMHDGYMVDADGNIVAVYPSGGCTVEQLRGLVGTTITVYCDVAFSSGRLRVSAGTQPGGTSASYEIERGDCMDLTLRRYGAYRDYTDSDDRPQQIYVECFYWQAGDITRFAPDNIISH